MLSRLFFLLTFCLVHGLFAHLLILSQKGVTRRYFLYHGLGALPFLIPALWLFPPFWLYCLFFAFFGAIGCLVAERRIHLSRFSFVVSILIGLILLHLNANGEMGVMGLITLTQSSLLLGAAMGAMCLGHWYLNQPKLSISELSRATLYLFFILAVRLVWSSYFLFSEINSQDLNWLMGSTVGLFFLMRYLWGLIAPAALSYFLWQTIKLSSTQSATGLLYVLVIMVLIGEIVSLYLLTYHGVFS